MPSETTTSEHAFLDTTALRAQLGRCLELCTSAAASVDEMGGERTSFLARNFEDALQQMELILRLLAEDASDVSSTRSDSEQEQGSFLKRLARGLARRDEAGEGDAEESAELPDLSHAATGLQGNTWTFSLPELVGFMAASRKTGVLWVDSPTENFLLGMVDGQLVHAASSATPEGLRLGEILVELGFLTARQLERFLNGEGGEERLSGELLLRTGMISEEELHTALSVQVQELFHRLLETRNAVFRFREGMEIMLAHQVSLNTTQLILESARVKDELENNAELNALAEQMASLKPGDTAPSEWSNWDEEALSCFAEMDTGQPASDEEPVVVSLDDSESQAHAEMAKTAKTTKIDALEQGDDTDDDAGVDEAGDREDAA